MTSATGTHSTSVGHILVSV